MSRIIVSPKFEDDKTKEEEFKKNSMVSWEEAEFIDPFASSRKEKLSEEFSGEKEHKKIEDFFRKIEKIDKEIREVSGEKRNKLIFLLLWRFLPSVFPWLDKHPADTRAPNHSNYDHCTQTSAIASSLPKPAFLIFTLGPVQRFIATSRKTSDLWSSSFLLSFLTFEAMKYIIEEFGPDHIIYPHLGEQPFVDLWIISEFYKLSGGEKFLEINTSGEKELKTILTDNITTDKITIGNIPNRFVSIIPYNIDIAKECEEKLKVKLENLSDKVIDKILQVCKRKIEIDKNALKNRIKEHLEKYFQVYWIVLPWFKDNYTNFQPIFSDHRKLMGGKETDIARAVKIMTELPYYEPVNVGLTYSLLLEIAERFLGARKSVRTFEEYKSEGEKCHLCGEFEVLENERFWKALHNAKPSWARKDERLCGICLTKRVLPDVVFDILKNDYPILSKLWRERGDHTTYEREKGTLQTQKGQKELKFPSTSEMATVFYKLNLPEDKAEDFKDKFEKFREKLKELKGTKDKILEGNSVPSLSGHKLYDIDGEWLMKESYSPERLEREYGIPREKFKEIKGELEEVLEIVRTSPEPQKYYALLLADGDEMGKWLKGEKMPKIKELLHQKVVNALLRYADEKDQEKILKLLCSRHPMSPSFHALFSRRLSHFAVREVREIVESESYGKLVYAGGDDVLALLPTNTAFVCAKKLNDAFQNSLSRNASISIGIVIAHHKYPLSLALDEVRDAERKAKNEYGRASLCVKLIKRQGEVREFGIKWKNWDIFDDILCLMRGGQIPSRLGYEIREVLHRIGIDDSGTLSNSLYKIFKIEVKRILSRKEIGTDFADLLIDFSRFYKSKPTHFADMMIILNEIFG